MKWFGLSATGLLALATIVQSSHAQTQAPDSLSILFPSASAVVPAEGRSVLDQAARLYRDGKPIVMVVTGATDSVGPAGANLQLSERRAKAVLDGLVARGIPVERFQIRAKGETEPAVATSEGVDEPRNRRVEINWR